LAGSSKPLWFPAFFELGVTEEESFRLLYRTERCVVVVVGKAAYPEYPHFASSKKLASNMCGLYVHAELASQRVPAVLVCAQYLVNLVRLQQVGGKKIAVCLLSTDTQ